MNWVEMNSLSESLKWLKTEHTDFVADKYSNQLVFSTENGKRSTSIVSSPSWLAVDNNTTIETKGDTPETEVMDGELYSIAKLVAKTGSSVDLVPEDDIHKYLWNGATYAIESDISFDTTPETLTLRESDFYSIISHTSRLVGEVVLGKYNEVRSHRRQLFNTTGDLARNLSDYYRPLGGTYLTIVKNKDGEYYLLLGQRNDSVVFWPNKITSFPAGYFKPTDISNEPVLNQHLLSEYSRELLNTQLKETADDSTKGVSAIKQLLKADQAWFEITGFGIEGFTVAGEITGVFCIENEEYTSYLFENLEDSYDVSNVTAIPLNKKTEDKLESLLLHSDMTPQTAFALGQGLQYISDETDIPFTLSVEAEFN